MKRYRAVIVIGAVMALLHARQAVATSAVSGPSGSGLSASAQVAISGTTLTILLTNTDTGSSGAEWMSAEALSGLFFDLGTSSTGSASVTVDGRANARQGQGGSSSGYLGGAGVGSSSFGAVPGDPGVIDEANFSIMPAGLGGDPLIEGLATFVLEIPAGLSAASISNVYFTYGASRGEPGFPVGQLTVALAFIGGCCAIALLVYRARRRPPPLIER